MHLLLPSAYSLSVGLAMPPLVVDDLRYRLARFPPSSCLPKASYLIYAMLLPINLALGAGCTLLIVNFWTVLKVRVTTMHTVSGKKSKRSLRSKF